RVVSRELPRQELDMFRSTDSRPDLPTDLVEFYSVRLFAIRESAHHHGFLHRDAMSRHRNRGPLQLPNPSSAVKDRGLLKVSLVSLGLAVTFLIVHTFLGVSAALATLLPAFLILVYDSSRSTEVLNALGRI